MEEAKLRAFEQFSIDFIRRFEQRRRNKGEDDFRELVKQIHSTQVEATVLTNGLYSIHLDNWLRAGQAGFK